ncbi:MAG: DUF5107 domain-containing protein [Lachnospiraceae bacterium]|nr:DUF5107 domain-containing protein [Lachnospiraceae bacterium]
MKSTLRFDEIVLPAADLGETSSVPDLVGHVNLQQSNTEFVLGETDEIYEGYGQYPSAYPYRQNNGYKGELRQKKLKTAVLENAYLRAEFLTELGGRLWSLIDKSTGKNLLYTNDVLQFRNLAVCNAWFSGGVEWNIGIIGHSPFTTAPLYVASVKGDGYPILRMYEYERIRRVFYQMDFWLEEESRFLNCRMRVVNPGTEVVPMYWWSNIAVPEHEKGRIIVPAKQAYTSKAGKVYKVDIPVVEGVDVTRYKEIPQAVDYFFELEKDFPTYIAHLDETGYGLLHLSTKRLQSRKLFSWGNNEGSDRWQEFLTKDAGRYIEIQAGLGKTQYGCIPMAPHTAWEWMEQYGPVQLAKEDLSQSYEKLKSITADYILTKTEYPDLEEKLVSTKQTAKEPASAVACGSPFGAWEKERRGTEHLFFEDSGKHSENDWQEFLKTGKLCSRDPKLPPGEFVIGRAYLDLLRKTVCTDNKDNWYAYYQLGVLEYQEGSYRHARKAFEKSLEIAENPWACHGLACVCLQEKEEAKTSRYICQGMALAKDELSYIKEGFRLLDLCHDSAGIVKWYEKLSKIQKQESRIRFLYAKALHQTGKSKEAFAILNENGGLIPDDFREGEVSVEQLWSEIQETLTGEKLPVPHVFRFSTNPSS